MLKSTVQINHLVYRAEQHLAIDGARTRNASTVSQYRRAEARRAAAGKTILEMAKGRRNSLGIYRAANVFSLTSKLRILMDRFQQVNKLDDMGLNSLLNEISDVLDKLDACPPGRSSHYPLPGEFKRVGRSDTGRFLPALQAGADAQALLQGPGMQDDLESSLDLPARKRVRRLTRKCKKIGINELPLGWEMDLIFAFTGDLNTQLAIATSLVTGARPAELQRGVRVKLSGRKLVFTIEGVKVSTNAGQEYRIIEIEQPDVKTRTP